MNHSFTVASVGGTPQSNRQGLQAVREAALLFWSAADKFTKARLSVAVALIAAVSLLSALNPIVLKLVVDSMVGDGGVHGAPFALVLLYVGGQYLSRCAAEVRAQVHGHAEQRVRRQISRRLFEHVLRLPLRFHLERKTGAIGETIEQGIRGYHLLLQHILYTILPVLIEFALVALVLMKLGHEVYLYILGAASLAYIAAFRHGAMTIRQSSRNASAAHIEAHALLTDSLLNSESVKYFDAETVVSHKYDAALGHTESAWHRFYTQRMANGVTVATIFAVSLGCSLAYAAADVAKGAITVGDFVLVNAYVVRLAQPLELLGFAVRDVAQGFAFLGGMLALFREETEANRAATTSDAGALRGELEFNNVVFAYRQDRRVLDGVSFRIPAGRTVAVVGVSGSGKSSLIRLLFRLYEPLDGSILLDGVPIVDMSLSDVRRAIAVVPQDTVLFHDTIASNIGLGRHGATQSEIEEAARLASLHEFIVGLPEGYETIVGERGLKLSGGERQRVAIARAALKLPRIFVFDEATSSLDSKTEGDILRNLVDLSRTSTTLVIAHRLSTVVHADQILVLEHGVIVERGTHDELRARSGGRYAALWNAQQTGASGRDDQSVSVA